MVRRGQPLLADMVHLPGTCMGSLTWDVLSYLRGLLRIRQGQDYFPEMRDIIQPVLHWLQDRLRRKPVDLVSKEAARVTLFDTLAEPPPYSTERPLARDRVDIVLNDMTEGVQQVGGMRVKYRGGMAEVTLPCLLTECSDGATGYATVLTLAGGFGWCSRGSCLACCPLEASLSTPRPKTQTR